MKLAGLELVTPRGQCFAWCAYRVTPNKLRIDEFVSRCRACGTPFRVTVRLLRDLAMRYTRRAELVADPRLRIELTRPMVKSMHNLQLVRCERCRREGARPLV